jgi:hypothetical protein
LPLGKRISIKAKNLGPFRLLPWPSRWHQYPN